MYIYIRKRKRRNAIKNEGIKERKFRVGQLYLVRVGTIVIIFVLITRDCHISLYIYLIY